MKKFIMSAEQLNKLLEACKPVTYMVIGGVPPRSPQENANAAWERLGREMKFDHTTVKPIPGAPQTEFMAEPLED